MNVNSEQINFSHHHEPQSANVDARLTHSMPEARTGAWNGADDHPRAMHNLALKGAAGLTDGESVLILYATVTGNSETLAKTLADALRPTGLNARVQDMAHCRPNVLMQANCVLVVASTYGDGEPPDDAVPFWEAIVNSNELNLSGVKYSVLALGNTTYDNFCKFGRELDGALEYHGATRLFPRVDCDAEYDQPARDWMDGVLATLRLEQNYSASA
jgi:sulfite reductase (NADPH) flavoprotein alpha-component